MVDEAIGCERLQTIAQAVAHVQRTLEQALATDDGQVGAGRGARRGVTRVGEPVTQEVVGVAFERRPRSGPYEHATERLIARGDRLGEGDEVGPHAETMGSEPMPEAAVAGDHFIEDEECAVLIAQAT